MLPTDRLCGVADWPHPMDWLEAENALWSCSPIHNSPCWLKSNGLPTLCSVKSIITVHLLKIRCSWGTLCITQQISLVSTTLIQGWALTTPAKAPGELCMCQCSALHRACMVILQGFINVDVANRSDKLKRHSNPTDPTRLLVGTWHVSWMVVGWKLF
jgi:hypothetical protein